MLVVGISQKLESKPVIVMGLIDVQIVPALLEWGKFSQVVSFTERVIFLRPISGRLGWCENAERVVGVGNAVESISANVIGSCYQRIKRDAFTVGNRS